MENKQTNSDADSNSDNNIKVDVETSYLEEQSSPNMNRYFFSYTVTIRNEGSFPAKLLTRHWIINDANGNIQEVHGEGVVGEQPYLQPGESFQYTSGTVIETPVGSMEGSYQMLSEDGTPFDADIPAFTLSLPNKLH
jgi:ApaG protein